jgi:hypothetical protein
MKPNTDEYKIMAIPHGAYYEKYCALADEFFSERHNIEFDSPSELSEELQAEWEDCVWHAKFYMGIIGIQEDKSA